MNKIDLKKELKHLYQPPIGSVVQVNVPKMNILMIDGEGDPNTSKSFQEAGESLFQVSYTLKFMIKKGKTAIDYSVMPLEGLWWVDDMSKFSIEDKSNWKWTVMIMQPSHVDKELVDIAFREVRRKKKATALEKIRFEEFEEGTAAQTMHIGPFSEEGPTIVKIHNFIRECGRKLRGKHHEIYLSDIRKGDPKKWKTIIRQPMT